MMAPWWTTSSPSVRTPMRYLSVPVSVKAKPSSAWICAARFKATSAVREGHSWVGQLDRSGQGAAAAAAAGPSVTAASVRLARGERGRFIGQGSVGSEGKRHDGDDGGRRQGGARLDLRRRCRSRLGQPHGRGGCGGQQHHLREREERQAGQV